MRQNVFLLRSVLMSSFEKSHGNVVSVVLVGKVFQIFLNNHFRLWSTGRTRLCGWRKISNWCSTRFLRSPKQRDLTASMATLSKSEINPFTQIHGWVRFIIFLCKGL